MNIIIIGATGMIGSGIVKKALNSDQVNQITLISRKNCGISHPKLKEIIHSNFYDFSSIKEELKHQNLCFYTVGVYTGQVPPKEFRDITVNMTLDFASQLKEASPDVVFCLLSGQGADRTEKSSVMFARDKGAAENGLVRLDFKRLHCFRPGYIYPVVPRKEPNLFYRITRLFYPLLKVIAPFAVVTSNQLVYAMFTVGMNGGKDIYENRDIQAI